MKRTEFKRRIKKHKPIPRDVVQLVAFRSQGCCERCGTFLRGVRGVDWSIHHRKPRSLRGHNGADNLLALCGDGSSGCHGWVGDHPALAEVEGTHVPSGANPTDVVVNTLGRRRRLLSDGRQVDVDGAA